MFLKREAKDSEDAGRGHCEISSSCLMVQISKHILLSLDTGNSFSCFNEFWKNKSDNLKEQHSF